MNLNNLLDNKDPDDVFVLTETKPYLFSELFVFIEGFKKKILNHDHDQIIVLKLENQVVLAFCIWACINYKKSFILLPFQIDLVLEKKLLREIICPTIITKKEQKTKSHLSINDLTSYQIKNGKSTEKKLIENKSIGFISSGTTGNPKLIWNSYLQFENSLNAIRMHNFMPYCTNQYVLISSFLTHSYGFSAFLEYMQGNSTIIIPSEVSFSIIFRLITNKKIQSLVTVIEGVPYFYKQLLVLKDKFHFKNLQHIGFGGDFVHETLLESLKEQYSLISFSIRFRKKQKYEYYFTFIFYINRS